jgi:hypothetical protein
VAEHIIAAASVLDIENVQEENRMDASCMEQHSLPWSVSFSSRDLVLDPMLTG